MLVVCLIGADGAYIESCQASADFAPAVICMAMRRPATIHRGMLHTAQAGCQHMPAWKALNVADMATNKLVGLEIMQVGFRQVEIGDKALLVNKRRIWVRLCNCFSTHYHICNCCSTQNQSRMRHVHHASCIVHHVHQPANSDRARMRNTYTAETLMPKGLTHCVAGAWREPPRARPPARQGGDRS